MFFDGAFGLLGVVAAGVAGVGVIDIFVGVLRVIRGMCVYVYVMIKGMPKSFTYMLTARSVYIYIYASVEKSLYVGMESYMCVDI